MRAIKGYFSGIRRMLLPLGSLALLVVADGVVTNAVVNGGSAREANFMMAPLVGDGAFIALKAVGALLCALILWDIYRQRARLALLSTWCLAMAYAGIVFWNLSLLIQAHL